MSTSAATSSGSVSSATAIEHIRPPMERPPINNCDVCTPSCSANARTSLRTHSSNTGVLSGKDLPARRYGKSMRATGNGDSASSNDTKDACDADEPAPGNNTTPAMVRDDPLVTSSPAIRVALQTCLVVPYLLWLLHHHGLGARDAHHRDIAT